jgi:hypothetical protein
VLFEPLHLKQVPEAEASHFSWRTYVPPDEPWDEGQAFLKRVFEGRVVNRWTSREMSLVEACKCKRLIVKFVRANRLLPWICRTFAIPPPVLLIRHPCAVIASQLKYGWKNARRPDAPGFIDEFPVFQGALSRATGDEEFLAATWALDQLPPLLQHPPRPWTIVTYEELVLRPEPTLRRIFKTWTLDVDIDKAMSKLKKPSSVVAQAGIQGINGWKKELSEDQVARILHTVSAFGLRFYSRADEADDAMLHGEHAADHIRQAGLG